MGLDGAGSILPTRVGESSLSAQAQFWQPASVPFENWSQKTAIGPHHNWTLSAGAAATQVQRSGADSFQAGCRRFESGLPLQPHYTGAQSLFSLGI